MGQALLEKEPPRIECYQPGSDGDAEGEWKECSKAEVCGNGIPRDRWRGDYTEPEYIDNWVEQYDLLCEPRWRIGLIGTIYFVGIMTTIILTPWLADMYGRKWNVVINYYVFMVAVVGVMLSNTIEELYVFIFICGATFAGRVIVSMNFLLEFITAKNK